VKLLIFEDEIPAKDKLVSFIKVALPEAQIVGWARSVKEAIQIFEENEEIDLIFSDIQLMDGVAFEIYDKIELKCPIIFCSAYDQYLFKAFKTNGIAYLLKPYDQESFDEAIEKYKVMFNQKSAFNINAQTLAQLKALVGSQQNNYKQRFTIKKKEGIKLLPTEDIVNFEASGDFSFAYDNAGQKHIVNLALGAIETKVNPAKFFRINRSEIVNVDYIIHVEPHFKNRLIVKLSHRADSLQTSSSKTPEFRAWLDA